ncbi:AAA family ATPase [Streptomyces sp. WMMC500]|uniref:helix-turn-helix transcriptional regulator n=1 Tax=Streptomyces sp. WMMC500 TaxID=3015154 RepID=UPI00248D1949|nr:LuxR family transcriptional regulator [Streptomyces sp. WMMC500]WBB61305.1 AAA family ATPase [Streptomyces sp. WMMC500]
MRTADVPLIERDHELAVLEAAVTRCRRGAGQLLLIEGGPGMGKSALLAALRRRSEAEGCRVLQARSDESEGGFPYGVVRQLFEGWLASAPPDERCRVFRGPAGPARRLFEYGPQDAPPVGRDAAPSAGDRQHVLLNGLYWMCVHLAERRPLSLLLDDVWWGDAPSLRFLHYLATRLDSRPILLGVTTDPAQKGPRISGAHAVVSLPAAELLRLTPLSVSGVRACLAARLGEETGSVLGDACHQATGGTPFYLRELVDELAAAARPDGGPPPAALVPGLAPPRVVHGMLRRLRSLPAPAVALVEAMAVLGTEPGLTYAGGVAGIDQGAVAGALGALVDGGLLRPDLPPRFLYPVVRAAIYHSLPATRRNAVHARAAHVLARAAAPVDDIARHLLHADVTGNREAVALLRRAARKAVADDRPTAAVAYLTRALQEPPAAEDEVAVLTELGRAEVRARLVAALDHLGQAMELSADPVQRGRIGLDLATGLVTADRVEEAVSLLQQLREEVGDRDETLGGRLDVALVVTASQASHLRHIAKERLRELARTDAASPVAARLLALDEPAAALRRGEPAARIGELTEKALATVFADGLASYDHEVSAQLWCRVAAVLVCCDLLGDAERLLTHALADAEETGAPIAADSYRAVRAWARYQRGRLAEAETDARHVLERADGAGLRSPMAVFAVGALTRVLIARHELDAAAAVVRTHDFSASMRRSAIYVPVLFARGRLHGARGDVDTAVEDILHGCRLMEDWGLRNPALLQTLDAAVLLNRAGRTEEAGAMVERLRPRVRAFASRRVIAATLRVRGLTAAPGPAVRYLEEAAELLAGSEARLDHATVLVDLGAALRRCERWARARQTLHQGLAVARRCGAWGLVNDARSELSAMGVRVRVAEEGNGTLTSRERRVAALAAEGIRNRDIAQTLFVTVKTVEWHLNRAYRKLGITSRHELPKALARQRAAAV